MSELQLDLPMSVLPSFASARRRAEDGMKRATDHAEADHKGWKEEALRFLRRYCETHVDFLTEDLIDAARGIVPASPCEGGGKAWGSVITTAKREGIIEKIGYRPARTSNLSPKPVWASRMLDMHAEFSEGEWGKIARNYVRGYRANMNASGFFTENLTVYAFAMGCPVPKEFTWWSTLLESEGLAIGATGHWFPKPCCADCAEH